MTPRALNTFLILSLLICPADARAQVTSASMLGVVEDQTGAVLPGVSITIRNVDTGITRTVFTDAEGRYAARQLALGIYEIQAELTGFQAAVRRGVQLTLSREAVVDFIFYRTHFYRTAFGTFEGHYRLKAVDSLPTESRAAAEAA